MKWWDQDIMILVFWMLSFKPTFSLSSFTFIKRLFSSSSLSAIRVLSYACLRLLIFLLAILIPACASSSPAFLIMYSVSKLNKQGDNIQLWCAPFLIWNQSVVPCPVLTVTSWPAYRFLKRQVRWSGIPISSHQPTCPLISEVGRPGREREADGQGPKPEHQSLNTKPIATQRLFLLPVGLHLLPYSCWGGGGYICVYFSSPDSRELLHLTPYWIKEGVTWRYHLPLGVLCQGRELRCPMVWERNKGYSHGWGGISRGGVRACWGVQEPGIQQHSCPKLFIPNESGLRVRQSTGVQVSVWEPECFLTSQFLCLWNRDNKDTNPLRLFEDLRSFQPCLTPRNA